MDLHRSNLGVSVVASCQDCDWTNSTRLFAEYGALCDLAQRHVVDTGHTATVEQHGPGSRYSPAVVPAYEGRAIGTRHGAVKAS